MTRFYKYQGTGNDFIMIDNRENQFNLNTQKIAQLCNRRFGIGADGLILLENSKAHDFKMVYFNADGNQGSMCGNGGRCTVAFAKQLNIIKEKTIFEAIDGLHKASVENNLVSLQMIDVAKIEEHENYLFLDTGSPHHVELVENIDQLNVVKKGAEIRNGAPYFETGTNVNFVEQISKNTFKVRTYERGVENETFSCGTGVTAVAIAMHHLQKTTSNSIQLETLGGMLSVAFQINKEVYTHIFLKGPAQLVFEGSF